MGTAAHDTTTVVKTHLNAFVQQLGVDAILSDYHDDARLVSEARTYHGKHEIRQFFEAFLVALPPRAVERFRLRTLRVDRDVACITWSVGDDVPLGTDTFVVREGRIATQTFAMHPPSQA